MTTLATDTKKIEKHVDSKLYLSDADVYKTTDNYRQFQCRQSTKYRRTAEIHSTVINQKLTLVGRINWIMSKTCVIKLLQKTEDQGPNTVRTLLGFSVKQIISNINADWSSIS